LVYQREDSKKAFKNVKDKQIKLINRCLCDELTRNQFKIEVICENNIKHSRIINQGISFTNKIPIDSFLSIRRFFTSLSLVANLSIFDTWNISTNHNRHTMT
jgi:hypothetical protein